MSPLRDKMRSSVICQGLGVEPLLFCAEVVGASGKDASWSPPCGGVPVSTSWEDAPVQTQRDYICTGLGEPWGPPVRAGRCSQRKGLLGPPAQTAASVDKQSMMDAWTINLQSLNPYVFV